jgi:hypothetical protein
MCTTTHPLFSETLSKQSFIENLVVTLRVMAHQGPQGFWVQTQWCVGETRTSPLLANGFVKLGRILCVPKKHIYW